MSNDAVIRVVDNDKTMTSLDKLRVRKTGGGYNYWVPESEVQTTTKHITKNGTYKAKDDGKYAYSEVTVNVSGGSGSADIHGKPTGGDIKPGGAGSAVVGTDPETGEEVVVGVDENGNLVQTPIPYGIKIVTPPTKTDYNAGDDMDYTGIGVKLTNKNGDTYTDVDHPSGWYVDPADLIFPVEKAPAAQPAGKTSDLELICAKPVRTCSTCTVTWETIDGEESRTEKCPARMVMSAPYMLKSYPVTDHTYWGYSHFIGTRTPTSEFKTYSHDGRTVYYDTYGGVSTPSATNATSTVPFLGTFGVIGINFSYEDAGKIAWTMVYGDDAGGTATIPVDWKSPYDGRTMRDTFEITSTPADGDVHTSTGSSGTEGSGGGGSF